MTFVGEVRDGVIVLEQSVSLPNGTRVRVQVLTDEQMKTAAEDLARMPDLAVETGIPDLATNADHYLYGHPKVNREE